MVGATANDEGLTLIELMVVVLIIGVVVMVAIPALTGATSRSRSKACYGNERMVEAAYSSYVASAGLEAAATMTDWDSTMSRLVPSDLTREPVCPGGGMYTWTDGDAFCSVHGSYH